MTKKQSKNTKVKKAVKPTKVTQAVKKGKPAKVVKSIFNKPDQHVGGKIAKPSPKGVKNKTLPKNTNKPVKKDSSKALKIIKTPKSLKKVAEKKTAPKTVTKTEKKPLPKKSVKAEKEIVKKTSTLITTIKKNKTEKPVKLVKKEKLKKEKNFESENEDDFIKPVKKSKGGRKPKNKNDEDDEPIVENDLLIEQLINSTKRLKKPTKIPKQLRTFTNPMASLTVAKLPETNKKGSTLPKKEPKGKFELEYVMHTSAGILYEFLTSPSGLAEWFADDVNIHDGVFTFFWEGSEQKAKLIGFKEEKFVRLQWLDKPDGTYFEFRIERDELTGDIALIITDFADEAADLQTSKLLWDSQINQLLHVIGSY